MVKWFELLMAICDFNGVVEEVNYEKNRLRVAVLIFGRSTPVEVIWTVLKGITFYFLVVNIYCSAEFFCI